MEYINILLIFAVIPATIFLYFIRHSVSWHAFILSTLIVGTLGIISDYIGLHRDLWFFSKAEGKMLGVWIWGVPLEDFIFVIVVPALVVGSYEFARKYIVRSS